MNSNQIWDPQGIEKISGPLFFLAMVFPQVKHLKNIRMPRLNVNCKCPGTFVASLERKGSVK